MLTALILQLVQCSVTLVGVCSEGRPEAEVKGECGIPEASGSPKIFEPAMETTTHFWKHVLQRWATPKAQDGADVKGIVENLIVDLLATLNVPEFPAASLLLQVGIFSSNFFFNRC